MQRARYFFFFGGILRMWKQKQPEIPQKWTEKEQKSKNS